MSLAELIQNPAPKLLDGAMGTELARQGYGGEGRNCLLHPEVVAEIHRQYLQSGARLIITNTLTMNRLYIETHNLDIDVKAVNLAAAGLARTAGEHHYVLGDISSTGQMLRPYGTYSEEQFIENFREQAQYLAEGGVDGFMIETMFDIREALCAVKGCRTVSSLPILACMAFETLNNGGRTMMGNSAAECAKQLTEAGVEALGANCGVLDPRQMSEIMAILRDATPLPLVAQPNAGKPRLEGERTVFDMGAAEFVEGIQECLNKGATLVGGCCGTTPGHIKALAEALKRL